MKIELKIDTNFLDKPTFIIEHNENTIVWQMYEVEKNILGDNQNVFKQINEYWSTLTLQTQQRIFDTYGEIFNLFDMEFNVSDFENRLTILVAKLYSNIRFIDLKNWTIFRSGLPFPTLESVYIYNHDKPSSIDQTYLRGDYENLLTFSIAIRMMIPIWSQYITISKTNSGTPYKEMQCFKLLRLTELWDNAATKKLKAYVNSSVPAEKSFAACVVSGISTEDFPMWISSIVWVKRIATADLCVATQDINLVTLLYHYVMQRIRSSDNALAERIRNKVATTSSKAGDEDSKLSFMESYKVKHELSIGRIEVLKHGTKDCFQCAHTLCPSIDDKLIHEALDNTKILYEHDIQPSQIALVQWIYKPIIQPRAMDYMPKKTLVEMVAVTQSILWTYEHYVLAGLVSAIANMSNLETYTVSGIESRARLPKDIVEELDKYYPYHRRPDTRASNVKTHNPAVKAIEELESILNDHVWILTLPDSYLPMVSPSKIRRYQLPHDIRVKIAKLVLSIGQREFLKPHALTF